jgi:hypothetical protein
MGMRAFGLLLVCGVVWCEQFILSLFCFLLMMDVVVVKDYLVKQILLKR